MRSSNPILRDSVLQRSYAITERPMTIGGTMNKLLLLSSILLVAAAAVYYQFSLEHFDYVSILCTAGCIISLVLILIMAFKPTTTPYLSPIYAFAQGAVISGMSCFLEMQFQGIVIQAATMTMLVVFSMALLYKFGLIRATEKFKAIIGAATLAIFVFYIISFILMLCNVNIPYFTSNSTLSIVVNVAIAVIAALNLIIDFDFIERGVRTPMPAVMEWYGAFGLLVTIIWLYVEILRILSRVRSR